MRLEPLEALAPATLGSIALADGLEQGLTERHFGLALLLDERHGHDGFVARLPLRIVPGVREHEPLGGDDLPVDAAEPEIAAVGRVHPGPPGSPGPPGPLPVREREPVRA